VGDGVVVHSEVVVGGRPRREHQEAAKVDVASSGLELLTGVLAIAVVRKLTARQLQRARRIASQPPVDEQ
jgi:hypothetical protein